ncbi:MAG: hypothetical protein KJO21_09615 [Verrucomicrobiae bacterium]|nr:hypothetical protein [Verrucomicrobiae bacterium]NNJ42397.1 hypothetical protein [Akkermansiaceae bacterium]
MEYMEKKYGWLKKEQPAKYEVLMKSRKDAERVWKSVAARIGRAKDYDEINKLKAPAHKANAVVELARLELRSAGSEISWMKSAKKSDSVAVEMIAQALIRNQKAIIEVTKKKMASDEELRQLAIKHNSLEKAMRDEYEKARNK